MGYREPAKPVLTKTEEREKWLQERFELVYNGTNYESAWYIFKGLFAEAQREALKEALVEMRKCEPSGDEAGLVFAELVLRVLQVLETK